MRVTRRRAGAKRESGGVRTLPPRWCSITYYPPKLTPHSPIMTTEPALAITRDPGLVTARVTGCDDLSAAQAARLAPRLAELSASLSGDRLLLDLGGVAYAGGRGLTALV